jgi:LysR family transcriptional regulator, transcriptional activator for bauABCD operon
MRTTPNQTEPASSVYVDPKRARRRELQFARTLDWNLLKIFYEIVDAKGLTRAAEELSRKQPAISLALRRLEDQLGVVLCRRGATGFELTDEGRVLSDTCRHIRDHVREVPARMFNLQEHLTGHIHVSMVSNLTSEPFDAALGSFHRKYPRVEFIVEISSWEEVVNAILQNRTDVGIAPARTKRAELRYDFLYTEAHRIYCGRHHPLYGRRGLTMAQLSEENYILSGADEDEDLTRFRQQYGLGKKVTGRSDYLEEVKRLAALGVGLCFLPEPYARQDVAAKKLWPLLPSKDAPRSDIYVITNPAIQHLAARDLLIQELLHPETPKAAAAKRYRV